MIGQTVGHYHIVEELGAGGMGVVYRAEDTRLRRAVALKFLPPELSRDEAAKRRFLHEAQAAAALDHPNICNIHEVAETADGQIYIAMACYAGETLRERIEEAIFERIHLKPVIKLVEPKSLEGRDSVLDQRENNQSA